MELAVWDEVVAAIYAAASAPRLWPEALQQIAFLFDCLGGLLIHRHDGGRYHTVVSPTLIAMAREYDARWQHHDVRAERVFLAIAGGHRDVYVDRDLFSDAEIAALPIYQKFLIPNGVLWGMAASVSPTPNVGVVLSLLRARDKQSFTSQEQERMQALSRHVERALSLSVRLMDAEAERLGFSEALGLLDCGAFVLDADQRILFANHAARRLVGVGLVAVANRLRATEPAAQEAFRALLREVEHGQATSTAACGSLVVPNGRTGLILQVMPVRHEADAAHLRGASAIVLVTDTAAGRPFDPAIVRDVFGLTLGEARLAALVGAGMMPGDAAAALGITEGTARVVLKRVFDKMGVSRQGELAALMGRLFLLRHRQPS